MLHVSAQPPPRKRRRTDVEGSKVRHPEITRDAEFWFNDGSIVLVARHVGFRVYRGLLSAQSDVLRLLFDAPRAATDGDIAGCPVVRLADSPGDLRHLLRALMPNGGNTYWAASCVTFDALFAIVSLSLKYGINDFLGNGLRLLQKAYPSSLYGHKERQQCNGMLKVRPEHAIGAVNLARLTKNAALLPIALYHCCLLEADVVDGWTRDDGTVEHLSRSDLKRCLRAQQTLTQAQYELAWACANLEPDESCESASACADMMRDVRADLHVGREDIFLDSALTLTFQARFFDLWDGRLCKRCYERIKACQNLHIGDLWSRLPEIFGLTVEGWY